MRWMAIELLTSSEQDAFSKEADVWAFGMTVYVRLMLHCRFRHRLLML